jgi:hypothetical protein
MTSALHAMRKNHAGFVARKRHGLFGAVATGRGSGNFAD